MPIVVFWLIFLHLMVIPIWRVRMDGWDTVINLHSDRLVSSHVSLYLEAYNLIFFIGGIRVFIWITMLFGKPVHIFASIWAHLYASLDSFLLPVAHLLRIELSLFLWLVLDIIYDLDLKAQCTTAGCLVCGKLFWTKVELILYYLLWFDKGEIN